MTSTYNGLSDCYCLQYVPSSTGLSNTNWLIRAVTSSTVCCLLRVRALKALPACKAICFLSAYQQHVTPHFRSYSIKIQGQFKLHTYMYIQYIKVLHFEMAVGTYNTPLHNIQQGGVYIQKWT